MSRWDQQHFAPRGHCQKLTILWVARLDDDTKLKVTDPKEQQGDVEEEEAKGKEGRDCVEQGASC